MCVMRGATAVVMLAVAAVPLAVAQKIEVSGDEVTYQADNAAVFRGNVVVRIDNIEIRAARLEAAAADNTDEDGDGGGNRYALFAGEGEDAMPIRVHCEGCWTQPLNIEINDTATYNPTAQVLNMDGGIDVCAGSDCAAGEMTAARGQWQQAASVLQLWGAPLITARLQPQADAEAIHIQAEHLQFNTQSGDLVLRDDAEVRRGSGSIRGKTIRYNANTGALSAEANEQAGGRVQATFESK